MLRAEMKNGVVATEGKGDPDLLITEAYYLLNTLRLQVRAGCETDRELAFSLGGMMGMLYGLADLAEAELAELAEKAEDPDERKGIREALKEIRKMRQDPKKTQAKIEEMRIRIRKEIRRARKKKAQDAARAEDEMKRKIEEE